MAIPKVTPTQAELDSTKPGGKHRADKHGRKRDDRHGKKHKRHHHKRRHHKQKKHRKTHRPARAPRSGPVDALARAARRDRCR